MITDRYVLLVGPANSLNVIRPLLQELNRAGAIPQGVHYSGIGLVYDVKNLGPAELQNLSDSATLSKCTFIALV